VEVVMAGTRWLDPGGRRGRAVAVLGGLVSFAAVLAAVTAVEAAGRIDGIELRTDGASTKVVVKLSEPIVYDVRVLEGDATRKGTRRLVLDFADATIAPAAAKPIDVSNDLLRQIRPGQFNARVARIVLDLGAAATHSIGSTDSPPEVTIALDGPAPPPGAPAAGGAAAPGPAAAVPVDAAAAAAVAAEPQPAAAAVSDVPKPASTPRKIPIRARGRRPYSLIYSR